MRSRVRPRIRLELPNHHKSAMKAIQAVSFEIKSKFPEARRNVLFDDESLDLVLDFCLGEGKQWKRMTSAQAMERKKTQKQTGNLGRMALHDGEIGELLDDPDSDGVSDGPDEINRG